MIPGFTTSMKTRPLIIAKMEEYTREKLVKLNSIRLVEELSNTQRGSGGFGSTGQ